MPSLCILQVTAFLLELFPMRDVRMVMRKFPQVSHIVLPTYNLNMNRVKVGLG